MLSSIHLLGQILLVLLGFLLFQMLILLLFAVVFLLKKYYHLFNEIFDRPSKWQK